ncbi:MAG TPA: penicillin acylase family protein [Devosia sp.]|nr:penicillin acylase family protein [Devosia sp.]
MTNRTPTHVRHLAGLQAEVEILVDRWGVPHIYGTTTHDTFFGQGFAVARDRLWQIDVWRKRGLGRLAADYGPDFVAADTAARLLLHRGDMAREWAAYGPEAKSMTEAFVAGINAYIDWLDTNPDAMPIEFTRTGTRPARWQAEDCVRIRSHGPIFNFGRELARADVVAAVGLVGEAARRRPEPEWTVNLAEGIAAEPVPPEVRTVFALATGHPQFDTVAEAASGEAGGSNNWAVSGARTDTGRPILASDPHRALHLPSLRYVSHLSGPDLDVIGAGEPAIPGVAVGHNATSAFCFTIHPADQSDLYVYELSADDPWLYRHGDGFERMEAVTETIAVAGEADHKVDLMFTRHGPVLHVDEGRKRAYAIRSIWSETGSAPYLQALRYQRVDNWASFVEARSHWKSPPVNHVYADTHGDIGWVMSGWIPVRPTFDGLLPVVGDGRAEWDGFMPAEAHPRLHNPEQGFVATANEMNLPADFDYRRYKPGFEWCDPSRYRVIAEQLQRDPSHSLADSCRLQTSVISDTARRLLPVLPGIRSDDPDFARARNYLAGWEGVVDVDSGPALLFELWFRQHLIEAVSEALAPGAFAHFDGVDVAHFDTLLVADLIVAPDQRLGPDPAALRDALVEQTLVAAFRQGIELAGDATENWRWGDFHHAHFTHPLAGRLHDDSLNARPVRKGGSGLTPNAADYRVTDFRMTVGASFRMVLDVGEWDRALFINAPGQSGDPRQRHYDDHLESYACESYLPLLFSRERIEAAVELRLLLRPAGAAE